MDVTELETVVATMTRQLAALRWQQANGEDVEERLNAADAALGKAYADFAATRGGDLTPDRICLGERRLQIHLHAALRAAVELDAEVAALRNRLDVRTDYLKTVGPRPQIAATDPDPARREDLWRWRNELGRLMKPDLLTLMRRRNDLARALGYADYPDLMLTAEETPAESLASFTYGLAASTDKPYRAVLSTLSEPPTTFDDVLLPQLLAAASGVGDSTAQATADTDHGDVHSDAHAGALAAIRVHFAALGLELPDSRVEVLVAEQDLAVGCTLATDPPRAAKVVLQPLPIAEFRPLACHELGHAVHYLNLPDNPTLGLIDPGFDEAIATYFEGLALWQEGRASQLDGGPAELAELRRLIASHQFELAAYRNLAADPGADLDALYAEHQSAVRGLVTPPSPIWAIDSFRAVDPMYIQYYIMARSAAAAMRRYAYRTYGSPYCREYAARIAQACRQGMSEPWLTRLTRLANPA